jgi:tetratricopeptide (TPR) repeat protein
VALVTVSAMACATTDIAPLKSGGDAESAPVDERYIWSESLKLEGEISRSGLLYLDPVLQNYLEEIVDQLVGEKFREVGIEPKVYVLSNVDMNAFALANGVVYVHTAMLARMENEAQLATLLGHEFAHAIRRHALRQHRDLKNKTAFLSTMGALTAGVPLAPILLELATVSSVFGYSRSLEREADDAGFGRLVAAGYDVREAPGLFEAMIAYQQELDEQGIERPAAPYFFSTHPRMRERIEDMSELVEDYRARNPDAPSGIVDAAVYRERTLGVTVHPASLELAAGRHRPARITVERVTEDFPDEATAWLVKGRAHAGEGESRGEARACYQRALELDASSAEAHHHLGLSFYREWLSDGVSPTAEKALRHLDRYLELHPSASDRGYVMGYIRKLRSSGSEPRSEETPAASGSEEAS